MKKLRLYSLIVLSFCAASANAGAAVMVDLGTAELFAVLAGSTVTNTGTSVIDGNLGLWPGTAVVGFPPGIVTPPGTTHATDAVALQAQTDLTAAYLSAEGELCTTNLTGQDLGGLTLTPGVYCFDSSAQLTGTLTLDSVGISDEAFIFQMGSTLTTASGSSVVFSEGSLSDSVFWQVGSSATLGTTTSFVGNILALTSISMNTGANIECGRALARNGAVTLDTNNVSINGCESETDGGSGGGDTVVPEPATVTLIGMGLAGMFGYGRRKTSAA